MNHLQIAIVAYSTLVLQITVADRLAIAGYEPEFPLLAIVAAFGMFEGATLLVWCGLIGFACDLLGPGPLGREMFAYALVAIFASPMFGRNESRSVFLAFVAGFCLAATGLLFSSAVDVLFEGRQIGRAELLERIAATSVYVAVLFAAFRIAGNLVVRLPYALFILATRR